MLCRAISKTPHPTRLATLGGPPSPFGGGIRSRASCAYAIALPCGGGMNTAIQPVKITVSRYYTKVVTAMAPAATAMTAVDIQPTQRNPSCTGYLPIILEFSVISIMMIITGTATTPLITALQ